MSNEPHRSELAEKLASAAHARGEELIEQNRRLQELVSSLEERYSRLLGEVTMIKSERDALAEEHRRLQSILDSAIEQNRRDIERSALVEQQCTSLANLYVATYKLHGSLERGEVVAAIREIVINLVGCEEFAILESSEGGGGDERRAASFSLISEFEPNPSPVRSFRTGPQGDPFFGPICDAGAIWVSGRDAAPGGAPSVAPTAVVPLRLKDRTIGVVIFFRLLVQKNGFSDVDLELMDLLSLHAATALAASRPGA